MRKRFASGKTKDDPIEWRSHEPSRLETFSDAVLAFALTLIIVSIEVPKSFDDLVETMNGTLSFAVCFALLFQIWNNQNLFFRRYGLHDGYTMALNAVLMFVVLIYAYPLKFLSLLIFSDGTYVHEGVRLPMIHAGQVKPLMLIYGAGFVAIYLLFYLMYRHALRCAAQLELTSREVFETKTIAGINLLCIGACSFAMLVAFLSADKYAGRTGFLYFIIPVCYSVWYPYRGKLARKKFQEVTGE